MLDNTKKFHPKISSAYFYTIVQLKIPKLIPAAFLTTFTVKFTVMFITYFQNTF